VLPDLGRDDFPLKRRQQPFRFGQGQTQSGDATETARPIDFNDILSLPSPLAPVSTNLKIQATRPLSPPTKGATMPSPPTLRQPPHISAAVQEINLSSILVPDYGHIV
jgi:hypothetical protein